MTVNEDEGIGKDMRCPYCTKIMRAGKISGNRFFLQR